MTSFTRTEFKLVWSEKALEAAKQLDDDTFESLSQCVNSLRRGRLFWKERSSIGDKFSLNEETPEKQQNLDHLTNEADIKRILATNNLEIWEFGEFGKLFQQKHFFLWSIEIVCYDDFCSPKQQVKVWDVISDHLSGDDLQSGLKAAKLVAVREMSLNCSCETLRKCLQRQHVYKYRQHAGAAGADGAGEGGSGSRSEFSPDSKIVKIFSRISEI